MKTTDYKIIITLILITAAIIICLNDIQKELIKEIEQPVAEIHLSRIKWQTAKLTMYNAGDPNQTDNSPCISASGDDICELLAFWKQGICAANFLPLGTIIEIKQLGLCIVLDRTAKKYSDRIDWALPVDQIEKARQWGIQTVEYTIID